MSGSSFLDLLEKAWMIIFQLTVIHHPQRLPIRSCSPLEKITFESPVASVFESNGNQFLLVNILTANEPINLSLDRIKLDPGICNRKRMQYMFPMFYIRRIFIFIYHPYPEGMYGSHLWNMSPYSVVSYCLGCVVHLYVGRHSCSSFALYYTSFLLWVEFGVWLIQQRRLRLNKEDKNPTLKISLENGMITNHS